MTQQPPPLPPVNPYAAPTARVNDVPIDPLQLELADRGARLAAVIVDGLIFGVVAVGFALGTIGLSQSVRSTPGNSPTATAMIIGSICAVAILALLVLNLVWLSRYGQTIAKRWLKIRIVRSDGSRCGLARIIFLRIFPLALVGAFLNMMLPALGYLVRIIDALFIFRNDYRCIHDHIADTIVVKA